MKLCLRMLKKLQSRARKPVIELNKVLPLHNKGRKTSRRKKKRRRCENRNGLTNNTNSNERLMMTRITTTPNVSTPSTNSTMTTNSVNSIKSFNYTAVSYSAATPTAASITRYCKINVNKKEKKQHVEQIFVNNLKSNGGNKKNPTPCTNNKSRNCNSTTNINNKSSINNKGECCQNHGSNCTMATRFSLLSSSSSSLPPASSLPPLKTSAQTPEATTVAQPAMPEFGLPTGETTTYISGKGNCKTVQLNSKQSKQCQQAAPATVCCCSLATPWECKDILASHEQLGTEREPEHVIRGLMKTKTELMLPPTTCSYSNVVFGAPPPASTSSSSCTTNKINSVDGAKHSFSLQLWPFSIFRQSLQYASTTSTSTAVSCNAGPTLGSKMFRGILMTLLVLSVCHNNVLQTSAATINVLNESISSITQQTKPLMTSPSLSAANLTTMRTNTTNTSTFVTSADQQEQQARLNQTNLTQLQEQQLPLTTLQQQTLENPLQILENNNSNPPLSSSERNKVVKPTTTIGITTGNQPATEAKDQILLMAPKQKRQQRGHQLPQYLTSTQGTSFVVNATTAFDGTHKNAFQATSMVGGRLIVPMDDTQTQPAYQQPPPLLPFNRSNGGSGAASGGSISEDFNELMPFSSKRNTMPVFDYGMPQNITARTGHMEAVLKCRVDRIGDKSVSWIRKRDLHILTVGKTTYTSDNRFLVTESKDSREWTLHVKSPQVRDSGIYECQVNTEPKMSMAFQLNIIEISSDAQTIITGPSDLYVKVGSVITLTCLVSQPSIKDIGPIHWYRGEHLLMPFAATDETAPQRNYFVTPAALTSKSASFDHSSGASNVDVDMYDNNVDDDDDDEHMSQNANNEITLDFRQRVAMEQKLCDTIKSKLRISNAQISDSGNYTCQPTTSSSASVTVHVINDENPAAMQKGGTAGGRSL
ncbi:defective proboscis extension response 3 [Musca autumnalis]|uniref:defective proboscis extension response 3 n=1 Tax=Musca autumnalis TaxID=221902 RepID=UPI003CEFBF97